MTRKRLRRKLKRLRRKLECLRWRLDARGSWRLHWSGSDDDWSVVVEVRWSIPLRGAWLVVGVFERYADALGHAQDLNARLVRPWHFKNNSSDDDSSDDDYLKRAW